MKNKTTTVPSTLPSTQDQHASKLTATQAATESPHDDLDEVLKQARHLGFQAKIFVDRSKAAAQLAAQDLPSSPAPDGTGPLPDRQPEANITNTVHEAKVGLPQTAHAPPADPNQNLTELISLLETHGLNLSSSSKSQEPQTAVTDRHASPSQPDSPAQQTAQLPGDSDDTSDFIQVDLGNVSFSIPAGNLSRAAAAELGLSQNSTSQHMSDTAANLPTSLIPDTETSAADVPAAEDVPINAADATGVQQEGTHLHDSLQAMPSGLHQQVDTGSSLRPAVTNTSDLPKSQSSGPDSSQGNTKLQQHLQEAAAFSGVFNSTAAANHSGGHGPSQQLQPAGAETDPAADRSLDQKLQHNGSVHLQQDGVAEADPSVEYSQEQAVVEPAEPIALDIHKEEEAHKAVLPLLAQHSNHTGDYKLTKCGCACCTMALQMGCMRWRCACACACVAHLNNF